MRFKVQAKLNPVWVAGILIQTKLWQQQLQQR